MATDISGAALAAARRGVYGRRAIRGIDPVLRTRYLTRDGAGLAVSAQLRRMVSCSRHNLVRDPPPAPGSFELITCRNVLIYFEPATGERVVASLQRALSPGGTLILGAADRISLPSRCRRSRVKLPRSGGSGIRTTVSAVRPGLPAPARVGTPGIRAALAAANAGELTQAVELIVEVLATDPLTAGIG